MVTTTDIDRGGWCLKNERQLWRCGICVRLLKPWQDKYQVDGMMSQYRSTVPVSIKVCY